jgi:hypothetical protein
MTFFDGFLNTVPSTKSQVPREIFQKNLSSCEILGCQATAKKILYIGLLCIFKKGLTSLIPFQWCLKKKIKP